MGKYIPGPNWPAELKPNPLQHKLQVLSSINVQRPGRKTKCSFHLRCNGTILRANQYAVQIIAINGAGPIIEWGCIPCGRQVVGTHLARLSRFQGWCIDSLNQINAADYFVSRITTSTPGHKLAEVQFQEIK